MDELSWLQDWYSNQCDGDWEHQHGINISTIDNPGWHLKIDLADTMFESLSVENTMVEISEEDWFVFQVVEGVFDGHGDPGKLSVLIATFRKLIESSKSLTT